MYGAMQFLELIYINIIAEPYSSTDAHGKLFVGIASGETVKMLHTEGIDS